MQKLSLLFSFLLIFLLTSFLSKAQVLTAYPIFVSENDAVTIYYHADEGNLALNNFSGSVYIHTGVITNLSTGPSDWKHVTTTWASTNAAFQMTSLGNNLYSFYIPDIRTYYSVTNVNETVFKIACVFRNGTGSIVGKNADNSDIYYDMISAGQNIVKFLSPANPPVLLELNDTYSCSVASTSSADISIFDNGSLLNTYNNTDSISFNYTASTYGKHWIKSVADFGTETVVDSFYFIVRPPVTVQSLPANSKIGINYLSDTSVRLVLCAPNKNYVYVIGEFDNWFVDEDYYMKKTPDNNYWWLDITGLDSAVEYSYQYFIDGTLKVADQYADKILDPDDDPYISNTTYPNLKEYPTGFATGNVSVLQTGQMPYNWQVTNFIKPNTNSLVIYELLIRDFISTHDYQTLIDTLNYLKTLGINAIELMPINEFEGNNSWGYNPSFYFAPDKYYGTKDKLKEFIDYCHQNGIAVIMDIALNHSFGQSPYVQMYFNSAIGKPTPDNPWFNVNPKHPFNVGYDMNHESPYTKKYFTDVTRYWLTEYKIDGYRFDLSKGFTQDSTTDVGTWGNYNQDRINIWAAYYDSIRAVSADAYLILEHFGANSEEEVLSDIGFMMWGNSNYSYSEAAMGFTNTDFSYMSYKARGWNDAHVVGFMESHDEERMMWRIRKYGNSNGNYKTKEIPTAIERVRLCANLFFTIPGPKMLWQFEELGYDTSILYGGANVDPKPIRWNYYQDYVRYRAFKSFSNLIGLKKTYPVFSSNTFTTQFSGYYKQIKLEDPSMDAVALGNFNVVDGTYNASFSHTGTWYNWYDGSTLNVTSLSQSLTLKAGEYRLYTDAQIPVPNLGVPLNTDEILADNIFFDVYPNPVSKESTISFSLSEQGKALVELYDLNGKLIKVLFEANNSQKGIYTSQLSDLNLSSGNYIIKVTTSKGDISKQISVN